MALASREGMILKRFLPALIAGAMILGVLTGFAINTHMPPADAKAAAASLSIITDIFQLAFVEQRLAFLIGLRRKLAQMVALDGRGDQRRRRNGERLGRR